MRWTLVRNGFSLTLVLAVAASCRSAGEDVPAPSSVAQPDSGASAAKRPAAVGRGPADEVLPAGEPIVEQVDPAESEYEADPGPLLEEEPASVPRMGSRSATLFRTGVIRTDGPAVAAAAAAAGLRWLTAHQSKEGHWDADGYDAECKNGRCTGTGGPVHDVGVTGLALMAFLGNGESHKTPLHGRAVRDGLKFLRSVQDAEGCFGPRTSQSFMYGHAIATLAMCEAYGLTQSPLYKTSAQNGVFFLCRSQNPNAGWRYGVRPGDSDTSVTGWCVLALKSAQIAGLHVDPAGFRGAKAFIEKVTDPANGRIGYTQRGNGPSRPVEWLNRYATDASEALTAEGTLVRIFSGVSPKDASVKRAMALVLATPPRLSQGDRADLIAYFFGSMLARECGGDAWIGWSAKVMDPWHRLAQPETAGCAAGSWDPVDVWGDDGGRVYSTALATLVATWDAVVVPR